MRRRLAVCDIIPPHILRSIAERGDDDLKLVAYSSLETSSSTRGERRSLALIASALAVAPGEKRRTIYDARHSRKVPGKLVRSEGDAPVRDAAVNEAFDGSGKTYDFFRKVLDRNSIDGAGMRLDSTVHYGVRFSNAQWNGRQMIFGDGDGRLVAFASPARARSLFTVRAAISSAVSSDRPRCLRPCLMCSY